MTKVLIAEVFPPVLVEQLRTMLPAGVELDMVASSSDDDFARAAADADIILCARRQVDRHALELAPKVRFIQQFGIGYDNLDVTAIAASGIPAAYNPGFNSVSVAEHTIMLMLALLRRFVAAEGVTRRGSFPTMAFIGEHQARVGELGSSTVGLVGLGSIGQAVAERLAGFGSSVLYTARQRHDEAETRLGVGYAPLPDLLAACDLVSLHVPLSPETHHLIGEAELAQMSAGALLVNTSRGPVVDEAALRGAIENGHLGGAAVDVLEDELGEVNPFADLPQVLVTPHIAGTSQKSLPRAMQMAVANIERFLHGEQLENPVPGTGTHDGGDS
jgi:phosphoglycerate dehydrogenase-like enzyme